MKKVLDKAIQPQIKHFTAAYFEQGLSLPDKLYFHSKRVKIIIQGCCAAQITSCMCKSFING